MNNVIDFANHKRLKSLQKNVAELKELSKSLKQCMNILNAHKNYSQISRKVDELFVIREDLKFYMRKKEEIIRRLEKER